MSDFHFSDIRTKTHGNTYREKTPVRKPQRLHGSSPSLIGVHLLTLKRKKEWKA